MKKIILVLVAALLLTLGTCIAISAEADASNDTAANATPIELNTSYTGTISQESKYEWYKFTLPSSGRIDLKVMTSMGRTSYYLYNETQTRIWGDYYSNGVDRQIYLVGGTYYLCVSKSDSYGDFSFTLDFSSADESFPEKVGEENNNSINSASEIEFGKEYKGQLANNDTEDYYKIVLPESGRVNLKVSTTIGRTCYRLYNASNVRLVDDYKANDYEKELYLVAGVYYFQVVKSDAYGNYSFNMTFRTSGESFAESLNANNNSIEKAPEIAFGSEYKGQLALNDTEDYYKIVVKESGRVNIKITTTIGRTYYRLYNASNVRVMENNSSNDYEIDVYLVAGVYYFQVVKSESYGNYSFNMIFQTSGESFAEDLNTNNNSIEKASEISFGSEYKGQLALNDTEDYYKIVVGDSGRIIIKSVTTMGRTSYNLYNSSNIRIWNGYYANGFEETLHLTAGTYYLQVSKADAYGNYNLSVTYKSAEESFKENQSIDNNTFEKASDIMYGTEYKGQLAINDNDDYYKIAFSESGRINLTVTTTMGRTTYYLYNASNVRVWGNHYSNGLNEQIYLTAGTYYLQVSKSESFGNYSLKATFESASESFAENQNTNNNSLENASSIVLGTEYKGQLAHNDTVDYYTFTLATPQKVTVSVTTPMDRTSYHIYNASNVRVWGESRANGIAVDTEVLPAGTYYLMIGVDRSYGNYSFRILEQHDCNTDGVRETPATCTTEGVIEKYCTVCNKVISTENTPISHTWGEWTVDVMATCTSDGSRHHTCTLCEAFEEEYLPTLEHEYKDGFCIRCEKPQYSPDSSDDGGCELVLGSSAIVMVVAIVGSAVILKKKED